MGSKEFTAMMFKDNVGKLWNRVRSVGRKEGSVVSILKVDGLCKTFGALPPFLKST